MFVEISPKERQEQDYVYIKKGYLLNLLVNLNPLLMENFPDILLLFA